MTDDRADRSTRRGAQFVPGGLAAFVLSLLLCPRRPGPLSPSGGAPAADAGMPVPFPPGAAG